jgi:hypothetical protein
MRAAHTDETFERQWLALHRKVIYEGYSKFNLRPAS